MHRRKLFVRALAFVLSAGTAVAAAAVTGLPAAAARSAVAASPSATPIPGTTATVVPLVTGDQVVVTAADHGQSSYVLRRAVGGGGAAESVQIAGDHYVIPAVAVPYLGRQLDRSLFDVSALARDGITGAARIPVTLTFAAGVAPSAPPGVTLTSVTGSSARGYLTARSAPAFTAALRKQIGADVAAGHRVGSGALPAGLASMNLAAPGGPVAVTPHYPLYILQLNLTDETGQPANAVYANLIDNTNVAASVGPVPVAGGVARVAVPAGDYSAYLLFLDFDAQGNLTATHAVTRNDFTVAAGGMTMEAFDERSASSAVSVRTPRPATADGLNLNFYRFDASGYGTDVVGLIDPGIRVYVSPQGAATVGRLHYVVQWGGTGTAPGEAYRYDVAFADDNIPARESFTVRNDQLAVMHQHFSADPAAGATKGSLSNFPTDPVAAPLATFYGIGADETMPGDLTDYLGTADGGQWSQIIITPNALELAGDWRTFAAGRDYSQSWAHGPLAADLGQHTGPFQDCLACTAGGTLTLGFYPLEDSEPDHSGMLQAPTVAHFTLYRDGTRIFDAADQSGAVVQGIPAAPSTYRAVFDLDLTGIPGFSQSTRAETDMTVKYLPQQGAALPAYDSCTGQSASSPCEILPALTLNYQLLTNEANTSDRPVQVLCLHIGHVSYDGAGSRSRITSAAVSVSFDGGTTWQPAAVAGWNGQYIATWKNPVSARGTSPEIRVTASDASGGSIAQTITSAYTIASSGMPAR